MPKPNDDATVIKFGLGRAKFTMAQPQHMTTKNIMAMNSATQAFLNTGVISSPSWMRDLGNPRSSTHAGQLTAKNGTLCRSSAKSRRFTNLSRRSILLRRGGAGGSGAASWRRPVG